MYQARTLETRSVSVFSIAAVLGMAVGLSSFASNAATFHVLPAESSVTFAGDVNGVVDVAEQTPGSLTTSMTGTLEATLTPGMIAFGGGSSILLTELAGPFLPGNQVANFAGVVENVLGDLDAYAIIKDVSLNITNGPQAVSGAGEFSTVGMNFEFLGGVFAYEIPGLADGSNPVFGSFDTSTAIPGTVEDLGGGVFKITIPFEGSIVGNAPDLGLSLNQYYSGQVVAVIPEPSSLVLLLIGVCGLGLISVRRLTKMR